MPHWLRSLIWFLVFLCISSYAVLYSLGYKVNFAARSIQRTGIIIIKMPVNSEGVVISINNKIRDDVLPLRFASVLPGMYHLNLKRSGYQEWDRIVEVKPNMVVNYSNVILFKNKPHYLNYANLPTSLPAVSGALDGLEIRANNELWQDGVYLTRFSQDIVSAQYFPDHQHLVLQLGNQLLVSDRDAKNACVVLESDASLLIAYQFKESGRVLIYYSENQVKALELYDR